MTAPTILFDIGVDLGGTDTSAFLHLDDATYGLLDTAKLGPDLLLTDVLMDRLFDFSISRTSSRVVGPIVTYEAGSATFTLLNDDGALDPSIMTTSPIEAAVRLRAQIGSTVYPVYRGFIKSWIPEHRAPTHSVVLVTAVDSLSHLADYPRTGVTATGAGEGTGARINRILDSVNWSAADRVIAVGDSTVQSTTLAGDALEEAQTTTLAEAGEFYCDESGFMFFRNRYAQVTDIRSNTSQGTFGSNKAGGELPYVGVPGLSNDSEQLINLVSATRVGGAEQVASDTASRAQFRDHKWEQSDLILQTDADAADWAGYVLHFDRLPEFRYTSLTIDARADETNLYPQMLGRRMGDRVTVVRRPPTDPWGGLADSKDVYIRSITHTWSRPNQWSTTWGLQPVEKLSYLVLDHATLGKLDTNALGY